VTVGQLHRPTLLPASLVNDQHDVLVRRDLRREHHQEDVERPVSTCGAKFATLWPVAGSAAA
jgi:hypothetical protein